MKTVNKTGLTRTSVTFQKPVWLAALCEEAL